MAFEYAEMTADDYMSVSVLGKVWDYQQQLRGVVAEFLNRNVFLVTIDLSAGTRFIPFADVITDIETNLKNLVGTDTPAGMAQTKVWAGGGLDERRFDYTDVNRWFRIMSNLYYFCRGQREISLISLSAAGLPMELQKLGVV